MIEVREVEREAERERGAGKKLPSAFDQPTASEMRTEGTSRLHLLACSPPARRTDPIFVSPCNLVQALEFSLMTLTFSSTCLGTIIKQILVFQSAKSGRPTILTPTMSVKYIPVAL